MKILLINNYQRSNETTTYEALKLALAGHDVLIQRYRPGLKFAEEGRDLIILSGGGGEGSEIHDQYRKNKLWYEDQINFILSTKKPIFGICMGFEIIARAYGSKVVQMKQYVSGLKTVSTTQKGLEIFNQDDLTQYQNHIWRVPAVSLEHFDVLAESKTGIEAIKHKTRPILATQFHPEKGGTLNLPALLALQTNAD